ncbi:MAG: glycosyltransferase family 4 protein [Candidatus Spechtbacteria bacterium]|nr:glycosyltransferase family 4 protein [Candidatus Spechtbacteria bacterium]
MLKIAINLSREYMGGITSSNINLINHLYGLDYFVGIELNSRTYMKGPVLFRNFAPEAFDHHIININHLPIIDIMKKAESIRDVENAYREPLEIIRNILRETNPDIVLLSGTYYIPWLISIVAKKEGIPVVLWYSGVLSRETDSQPTHMRALFALMEKSIVSRAAKIIFPSQLCKSVVEEEVIKHRIKNCYVIPNPASSIFMDPCAVEYSVERRIAAVGRYSRVKNFDLFFLLHKELLRRKWKHSACFVTNSDARLKNIPKSIEILPPMAPEGLKEFYISQGLIICPSSFETFGNVPMEAVCLGVPVLVSNKMGCAEILSKVGLENMVISFDDIEKVADRVQELCGQSVLPKQLNALKRILDSRLISEEIKAVLTSASKLSGSRLS